MKKTFKFLNIALLCLILSGFCAAQNLNFSGQNLTLKDFNSSSKNVSEQSLVSFDFKNPKKISKQNGSGIILLSSTKQEVASLQSKKEFGDLTLSMDFMLNANAKFSIAFLNQYLLNLGDSWGIANPTYSDLGGIVTKPSISNNSKIGNAPLSNAANAPGLWQQLLVKFKATEFDASGKKTNNARFLEVYINGVLVQQNVELPDETVNAGNKSLIFTAEGDVAVRDIKYTSSVPKEQIAQLENNDSVTNPILLEPNQHPYLLRSFIIFNRKKLTHTISVGSLDKIHFTYNPLQGSLIQIWKGGFMDVTDMWHERGEPQTARPLGNPLKFLNAPTFGVLNSPTDPWADSLKFDDIRFKGYALNQNGYPTFKYEWQGLAVEDEIIIENHQVLRTLKATGSLNNLYARLVSAKSITDLGNNFFVINDREYYIDLKSSAKAIIRESNGLKELVIPYQPKNGSIQYAIIW